MNNERDSIERMHTDASLVPGPVKDGKIWLNSASVVDRILRDFVREIIDILDRPDFQERLEFECRRLNNLFLGITPSDKYSTGPWNTLDQCGDYVLQVLTINGESRTAVRDAFMIFALRVIVLAADEFDPIKLDVEIDRMRHALLGTTEAA